MRVSNLSGVKKVSLFLKKRMKSRNDAFRGFKTRYERNISLKGTAVEKDLSFFARLRKEGTVPSDV